MDSPVCKPSIAYLTSVYARAGDTFIRREVQALRQMGWTIRTFSIRRADASERVSEDIASEQATTVYILEQGLFRLLAALLRMSFKYPARMRRAILQAMSVRWPGLKSAIWHFVYLMEASYLAEQLIAARVELLHNHIAMNSATVAMLASTLSGVPYSLTVHGPHEFFASEHWALGAKVASSVLTVCISHYGKSQCMLFSRPEHWNKLRIVRCGLENQFLHETSKQLPERHRLICVGRISPEKGQLLLVDAVAELTEEGVDLELVIAGDGPFRDVIANRIHALQLQDTIRLTGWQSSDQVRQSIEESSLLVLPSFAEGIPVVLMEAMALGRPVIATYVGGVPELVTPNDSGWLVPAGSVPDLADAIRDALSFPPHVLAQMGQRGRQQVLAQHSIANEARKLGELFEKILEQARMNHARPVPNTHRNNIVRIWR